MIREKINKEIGSIEQHIQSLEKLRQITDIESPNVETKAMLIYLEHEGVSKAYTILNDLGHRVPGARGERKFTSNDVRDFLEANLENEKVDANLRYLVKGMLTRKHKHIKWMDLLLEITNEI